jgi:hypothetical protein
MPERVGALGNFVARGIPSSSSSTQGGGIGIETVSVDIGGGAQSVSKWNKNSLLCFGLTSLLILAGIGVATWYTIEEMNSNTNSTR